MGEVCISLYLCCEIEDFGDSRWKLLTSTACITREHVRITELHLRLSKTMMKDFKLHFTISLLMNNDIHIQ